MPHPLRIPHENVIAAGYAVSMLAKSVEPPRGSCIHRDGTATSSGGDLIGDGIPASGRKIRGELQSIITEIGGPGDLD